MTESARPDGPRGTLRTTSDATDPRLTDRMRILVLGGTAWVGGAVAAEASRLGHEVVCLARGESGAAPDGVRLVRADRDRPGAYDTVVGQRWDAVVDVARQPGHVRRAVAALEPAAARVLFVSTGNVYADFTRPHADETAALRAPLDSDEMASMELYGEAKAACERAVLGGFGPERALIARAGLIGGPGDRSGRSGYWPWRFAHPAADRIPVPAEDRPTELIDVRDLATWLVRCAEGSAAGVFDAVGPEIPLHEHLRTAARIAGWDGVTIGVPDEVLTGAGIAEWMGPRSLPLWLADPGYGGFAARSGAAARVAGLTHRSLEETLRDTLVWEETQSEHPHGAGLTDDEQRDLLAAVARTG